MDEEIRVKIQAQKKYCEENHVPHFAPKTGFCFNCGRQIYTRISLEYAANRLITGCPYCHSTYCD